jgi:hypothetical protein
MLGVLIYLSHGQFRPSRALRQLGILPGVSFALQTYARQLTAIAFEIESHPTRLDKSNRENRLTSPEPIS